MRLELRNILKALEIGMPVKHKNDEGFITYICDDYITICVREIEEKEAMYGKRFVNVLVYQKDWDNLEIDPSVFQSKRNYRYKNGRADDHPGNDLLPPIDKR